MPVQKQKAWSFAFFYFIAIYPKYMHYIQIADTINSIEKSHKKQIENFFLTIYPLNQLISHGLSHHRRVWENAKELILNSAITAENIDSTSDTYKTLTKS